MRGKEGVSLGTCSARTSQASRMRVACASQLYNYILRFHLTATSTNTSSIARVPLSLSLGG